MRFSVQFEYDLVMKINTQMDNTSNSKACVPLTNRVQVEYAPG